MILKIPVPNFVVNAIAGKVGPLILGGITTACVAGYASLQNKSPFLANLLGTDPATIADRLTLLAGFGVASLGNVFHIQTGSILGRIEQATVETVEELAASDLAAKGQPVPAVPVRPTQS
jgi:hypothetical protein